MLSRTRGIWLRTGLVALTTLAACGEGGQGGSGPNYGLLAIEEAGPTGNNQAGSAGGDLPLPVHIVALRDGAPAAGAVVLWSATGSGGFMRPSVDTTGADGSPVSFGATALAPDGAPGGVTVQLLSSGGNRFEPANLTIPAGTKVTWTWVDGFHNVVSGGNPTFTSSEVAVFPPHSYSFTFTTPGNYSSSARCTARPPPGCTAPSWCSDAGRGRSARHPARASCRGRCPG